MEFEVEVEVEVVKLGPEKGSHRVHQHIDPVASELLKYDGGVDVGPSADKRDVRGAWAWGCLSKAAKGFSFKQTQLNVGFELLD